VTSPATRGRPRGGEVLLNRAGIWSSLGDGARAVAEEEQAVALLRRLEDPLTLGAALSNLALHYVEGGAPAKGAAARRPVASSRPPGTAVGLRPPSTCWAWPSRTGDA
jgi:hypothetical protein